MSITSWLSYQHVPQPGENDWLPQKIRNRTPPAEIPLLLADIHRFERLSRHLSEDEEHREPGSEETEDDFVSFHDYTGGPWRPHIQWHQYDRIVTILKETRWITDDNGYMIDVFGVKNRFSNLYRIRIIVVKIDIESGQTTRSILADVKAPIYTIARAILLNDWAMPELPPFLKIYDGARIQRLLQLSNNPRTFWNRVAYEMMDEMNDMRISFLSNLHSRFDMQPSPSAGDKLI